MIKYKYRKLLHTKIQLFQAHGSKTIKCCGDAKIELFAGAQHPDTTLTSWYDLNLALDMIMCPIQITILAV